MISFWEKRSFIHFDFLVIGGGIVGLSTAIAIKEKSPSARVGILERGVLPSGASTKNAGFGCFGSLTELVSDLNQLGAEKTLLLVEARWQGLQMLLKRLGVKNMDYHNHGGYELLNQDQNHYLDLISGMNAMLKSIFKADVFHLKNQKIAEFGFRADVVTNLIFNPLEGQLDTGKMMRTLINMASEAKVEIITGAEVTNLEENAHEVRVVLADTHFSTGLYFTANKVAVCTNAFTKQLVPALELKPGRGQVIVTSPIKNLPLKGTFHFDEGYYYFRDFENRILFGGGRNLDFHGESTTSFDVSGQLIENLRGKLQHLIIPGVKFKIDQQWAGIMAFGNSKEPILDKISDKIIVGAGLGGMGVALGSMMGDNICQLIMTS